MNVIFASVSSHMLSHMFHIQANLAVAKYISKCTKIIYHKRTIIVDATISRKVWSIQTENRRHNSQQSPPGGYVFTCVLFVCLSVWLSVRLLKKLWTDGDEIFWRPKDQVTRFWWRSRSPSGSRNFLKDTYSRSYQVSFIRQVAGLVSTEVCALRVFLVTHRNIQTRHG